MKTSLRSSFRALLLATSIACAPLGAGAVSNSELLEKGIYNEDTKGDLDAAITIYQQLIADARAAQSLAAQAQFRLGQCYLKKNRPAEAAAAFAKLIRDFPGEKQLVAKAREHLPGDLALGPVPGKVLITGAVRSQGELALPPDEPLTVSRAILQMGGFAELANQKRVEIHRKGEQDPKKQKIQVDVGQALKGKSDHDPVLQGGDHVIVSEKFRNF